MLENRGSISDRDRELSVCHNFQTGSVSVGAEVMRPEAETHYTYVSFSSFLQRLISFLSFYNYLFGCRRNSLLH